MYGSVPALWLRSAGRCVRAYARTMTHGSAGISRLLSSHRTARSAARRPTGWFGFDGIHYTETFDPEHLPRDFRGVRKAWRAFYARAMRWHGGPFDWIYAIEGLHGDHRYHIHCVLRYSDFSPEEVRALWKYGAVDDEPVLRMRIRKDPQTGQAIRMCDGGYRRLAEYFNKERTDGIWIPIGRHPWSCSRTLTAQLPEPERWKDSECRVEIPDCVIWSSKNSVENSFGCYYFASYIEEKPELLF